MRIILFFLILTISEPSFSQISYRNAARSNTITAPKVPFTEEKVETKFKDTERSEIMEQNIKTMRGYMDSSRNTTMARNLLFLKEVLDFKLQDETLAPEIEKLKQNREFNTKLLKALNQLDNKKNRNNKNQQIMNILNNSGNTVFNSLVN